MMKVNFKQDLKYGTLGPDEPQPISAQELKEFHPETGALDTLGAMYNLSAMDSTTHALLQHSELSDAEARGGEVLSPDKLNEAYPGLPTPFTEPKSQAVAQIIADRQHARKDLSDQIAAGPQGRLFGIARFGAAMLPHALDPVNIGAGFAVGALTAGFGGLVVEGLEASAAGARAVQAVTAAAKAAPNLAKFAAASAEGIAGNAVGELAVARSAVQEGREYSAEDAFINTVGGAMMVPGAVLGFRGAKVGLAALRPGVNRAAGYLGRISPRYAEMLHETSIGRLMRDKLPATDAIKEQAVRELEGEMPSFAKRAEYAREPLTPERPLYAATFEQGGIRDVETAVHDEFLGDAAYLSDDPRVANGAGGRAVSEGNGRVLEVSQDNLNLIDLNEPARPEIASVLGELGVKVDEKAPLMDTMREIQDRVQSGDLPPETLNKLNEGFQAQGYDGYLHDGSSIEGTPRAAHNSIAVFNREKLTDIAEHAPEGEKLGQVDPERIAQLEREAESPLSQLTHEAPDQQVAEVSRLIEEPPRSERLVEIQAREAEVMDNLASLERQGLLDEKDLGELTSIKESATDAETIIQHLKDAATCILLGDD